MSPATRPDDDDEPGDADATPLAPTTPDDDDDGDEIPPPSPAARLRELCERGGPSPARPPRRGYGRRYT